MTYEKTGKKVNKDTGNNALYHIVKTNSTSKLIWYITRKHKTGLFAAWAVLMTLLYVFPALPDVVLSLVMR